MTRSPLPASFLRPAAAVLLCAGVLLGCGREGPDAPSGPSATHRRPATARAAEPERVLPLDRYFLTPSDTARIQRGIGVLVADCMRGAGLRPPPGPLAPPPSPPRNERRYGVTDAASAAEFGYHLPPVPSQVPGETLDRARSEALTGTHDGTRPRADVPAEGCIAASARQVTGAPGYPADPENLRRLNVESFERSLEDPGVVRGMARWSACMREEDFRYRTPLEPSFPAHEATPEERRTALADIACKRRTGLVELWYAAETGIQRDLIHRHRAELDALMTDRARLLARADRAGRNPST
ncbi:hypothetical protein [Streptomyces sp. NPDC049590]|uniref:hypothetical protein n=1 Tax=Streptomyces sp. NPDC049590 TaxID=3154834 RepID=UPI003434A806